MSDFNLAIPFILSHEGGYTNNLSDSGGETNFGISKRSYPNVDIKNLLRDQACAIYKRDFWDPHKYSLIVDQKVANKIFDMCVNMGASRAHKIAQQALNVCGKQMDVDGVLGPISIACINDTSSSSMLDAMCSNQASFYNHLVTADPDKAKFLAGWLNRAAFRG